jgi:photosystem II stability/assembly factor-like uncharacterized protein
MRHTKRVVIIITLLGLAISFRSNAQWIKESVPTNSNLNSVFFLNDNSGWIVGDNGVIMNKKQGEWVLSPEVTERNLNSVSFSNENNGWAVGAKGTILHYNGIEWSVVVSPTTNDLYSISLLNDNVGIASGDMGTILVYNGQKWTKLMEHSFAVFYALSAIDDLILIGGGREYLSVPVLQLTGLHEKKAKSMFDPEYFEISCITVINKKDIWATGRPGSIFHYDGSSWKRIKNTQPIPSLNSIYFSDSNYGIAVGYYGKILSYSHDRGWLDEESPVLVNLNAVTETDNTWYAVGNNGTVVINRHTPETPEIPESKFVADQKVITDQKAIRLESFPNPPSEQINIKIPNDEDFQADILTITNSTGQLILKQDVRTLAGGELFKVNTSGFGNGIYIINILSTSGTKALGRFMITK